MIATTTGWDINPRVLGTVPKDIKVAPFDELHWVTDAHYAVVPKGVSADKLAVNMDLMKYMLSRSRRPSPTTRATSTPARRSRASTLDMAPAKSQKRSRSSAAPEYEQLIEEKPKETPLLGKALVKAFDKWDREIGGSKVKE